MNREIALVLDTSALLSLGTMPNVGEVVLEIGHEGRCVRVPTICVVQALVEDPSPEFEARLKLLLSSPTLILDDSFGEEVDDLVNLAHAVTVLGDCSFPQAAASVMALRFDVDVMTAKPDLYFLADGPELIVISD